MDFRPPRMWQAFLSMGKLGFLAPARMREVIRCRDAARQWAFDGVLDACSH
jgi:hypothetical protein